MILFFLWSIASAWGYGPLEGLRFKSSILYKQYIENHNINIYYEYKYHKDSDYIELIVDGIEESSNLSISEIKKSYPSAGDCKPNDIIEIYEVESKVLNDEKRFDIKKIITDNIWGFYDPRVSEDYVDSIVLTSHGRTANYTVLVHEIAHYWYSRFCLESYASVSSEQFATLIQNRIDWSIYE